MTNREWMQSIHINDDAALFPPRNPDARLKVLERRDSMERTCGNCIFFEKDDGSPYCLLLDLYTEREQDDEACEDFEAADDR